MRLIVLGCSGGPDEWNLSGYLLGPEDGAYFIALDTGTLLSGIKNALSCGAFKDITLSTHPLEELFHERLKAYLITHAHLDHVAGLIINSQRDVKKPIFGLPFTIENIQKHLFNGKIWSELGSETPTSSHLYQYIKLIPYVSTPIKETDFSIEAYPLSHQKDYLSTAFLITLKDQCVLYFGDTGSDKREQSTYLNRIWHRIAPLIRKKKLSLILLECSYLDVPPKGKTLFGHLNVEEMIHELSLLATITDPKNPENALQGVKVMVSHIKEDLKEESVREAILQKLSASNHLGIEFILPIQGKNLFL